MKLTVYSSDGSKSQEKEFANMPELEPGKGVQALKDLIVAYQANLRQGNASTLRRGDMKGGGKKPFRQKGTGMARRGSNVSPILVGGGVVFGPKPRDYTKKVNGKVRKLAFQRAIFDKANEGAIQVIEALEVSEPKTKAFNSVLTKIQPKGKVLVVDAQFADNTVLAARNIERVGIIDAASLNAYDLLRYDTVLISEKGLETLLARAS